MTDFLFVAGGLIGLGLGGDMLVRGAVALATLWRVSPLVIGLTLVGFGTSVPELVTSLQAALAGSPGIAVGNVVGSNIGNVLLILGIGAVLAPIAVARSALLRDGSVMALASVALVALVLGGTLGRAGGALGLLMLAIYVIATIRIERRRVTAAGAIYAAEADLVARPATGAAAAAGLTLAGLVLTILAARLLVTGAIGIAQLVGLSEAVIGLTVVAIGTSLPELVTTVIAARRNQGDVALGNILGSNIFNILGILGVTALVLPLQVPARIAETDIWVMLAATVALLVFAATGGRIDRREGAVLLAAYLGYVGWMLAAG